MNRFAEIAMPVLEWTIAFWWVYLVLLVGYGAFLIWFWEALRGEAPGHETSLAKGIAQLLLQWERFRVLFNLMLIWEGVLLLSLTRMLEEASKHHEHTAHGHWFWGMALLCCVVANGFFSLGPLAEAGAHMTIRIRFGQLRLALFGLLLLPPSLVMWLLARRQWGHVAGYL